MQGKCRKLSKGILHYEWIAHGARVMCRGHLCVCGERERETANIIYKNISKMCAAGYAFYAAYNALIHANRTHTYMIMDI